MLSESGSSLKGIMESKICLYIFFIWQIKSMKELYFAELSELYQKIVMKFQQVLQLLVSALTFF